MQSEPQSRNFTYGTGGKALYVMGHHFTLHHYKFINHDALHALFNKALTSPPQLHNTMDKINKTTKMTQPVSNLQKETFARCIILLQCNYL